jgi:hypothetical protein
MKKFLVAAASVLALGLSGAGQVRADNVALTLEYILTDNGDGTYQYDFTLRLDNNDGSWQPGQGFGWFIFGDARNMMSPIADFQITYGLPVGPWDSLTTSGGFHNGPTFNPVLSYWVPDAVGDSLQWGGISTVALNPGELLFSSIVDLNRPIIEFAVADDVTP